MIQPKLAILAQFWPHCRILQLIPHRKKSWETIMKRILLCKIQQTLNPVVDWEGFPNFFIIVSNFFFSAEWSGESGCEVGIAQGWLDFAKMFAK